MKHWGAHAPAQVSETRSWEAEHKNNHLRVCKCADPQSGSFQELLRIITVSAMEVLNEPDP